MKSSSSLQLLTLFGIPIRVHFTFLFLVLWVGLVVASRDQPASMAILLLILVFACVVLHELGHALMAKRFGITTREIVLYPIGGIARLEGMPAGMAELLIALAGPLVNLVIAFFALIAMLITGSLSQLQDALVGSSDLTTYVLGYLFFINVMLFAFNLVPAFPMDGGRILRAFLSLIVGQQEATRFAAMLGQGVAILMGVIALFSPSQNLVLLLIAVFVFFGAGQEAAYSRTRAMVQGRTAKEAMMTRFETLAPQDSLEWATRLFLATHQRDFPVVDAWGRIAGLLDRQRLMEGIRQLGRDGAVLDAMDRDLLLIEPETPLEDVLQLLNSRPARALLVSDGEKLLGILTIEKLSQFIDVIRRI